MRLGAVGFIKYFHKLLALGQEDTIRAKYSIKERVTIPDHPEGVAISTHERALVTLK